jgi:hypothetical protein
LYETERIICGIDSRARKKKIHDMYLRNWKKRTTPDPYYTKSLLCTDFRQQRQPVFVSQIGHYS